MWKGGGAHRLSNRVVNYGLWYPLGCRQYFSHQQKILRSFSLLKNVSSRAMTVVANNSPVNKLFTLSIASTMFIIIVIFNWIVKLAFNLKLCYVKTVEGGLLLQAFLLFCRLLTTFDFKAYYWDYPTGQNYWMLIGLDRGHFFLIFLQWRAKLLDPDWLSGTTYSLLIGWAHHFCI